MSTSLTIECAFHVTRRSKGRQEMQAGESPRTPCERGRVPRVSKLLALAHRFQGLVRKGEVADYAALARLGRVSRARISQIMSLLSLAPDLQSRSCSCRGRNGVATPSRCGTCCPSRKCPTGRSSDSCGPS